MMACDCGKATKGKPYRTGDCLECWKRIHGIKTPGDGLAHLARLTAPRPPAPARGPGTELARMLADVGLTGCMGCMARAAQMDAWGVAGCKGNRERIVGWLRESAAKRGMVDKLKAGALALTSGLAFHVNPLDVYGSLVDEAIRRAEGGEAKAAAPVCQAAPLKWTYGLTTIRERYHTLLPRTLASLRRAGFDRPRLFVDGDDNCSGWEIEFGLDVTCRGGSPVRTAGHWSLTLAELYFRDPTADRYAVFQDDFVTYRNLRAYLEQSPYPSMGYLNLYTFRENEKVIEGKEPGWYLASLLGGGPEGFQTGRGAVALVFSRQAVLTLLASPHLYSRAYGPNGWRSIDGGIVTAMNQADWREYVHAPSLVQHTGDLSSMILANGQRKAPHAHAQSFRGEDFDALDLLKQPALERTG